MDFADISEEELNEIFEGMFKPVTEAAGTFYQRSTGKLTSGMNEIEVSTRSPIPPLDFRKYDSGLFVKGKAASGERGHAVMMYIPRSKIEEILFDFCVSDPSFLKTIMLKSIKMDAENQLRELSDDKDEK